MYDYGSITANQKVYGESSPPIINLKRLEKSKIPVAIFVGKDDDLGDISDSQWLRD